MTTREQRSWPDSIVRLAAVLKCSTRASMSLPKPQRRGSKANPSSAESSGVTRYILSEDADLDLDSIWDYQHERKTYSLPASLSITHHMPIVQQAAAQLA